MAKLDRLGRKFPVACDLTGKPVDANDPNLSVEADIVPRWRWTQLNRAERLARQGQPQTLEHLRELYGRLSPERDQTDQHAVTALG